jgi:GTP-binding protein
MDIISAKYLISSATYKQCPKADKPEYAFIGRSNVGKSSLINMLTGQTKLAKTSATPGKTQLINHFEVLSTDKKKWYLVDLPGYGYAKRAQTARNNWENMIESYIRKRENLVNIFVLVDSRREPQPIDLEFVRKLGEWQVPFSIVFTKTDKNKPGATVRNIQLFLKELETEWEELPPNFATSAIEKEGRKELLKYISTINIDISTNYKKN